MGCHNSKTIKFYDLYLSNKLSNPSEIDNYINVNFDKYKIKINKVKKLRDYRCLVFEGGGIKGLAYNGVIKELYQLGIISKINRYAGSSIGALFATLLALGYTPSEIRKLTYTMDFNRFKDSRCCCLPFISNYGYYKGHKLLKTLRKIVKNKTGNPDYTFKNLFRKKGIELVITATNLNLKSAIYFSPIYSPNLPIATAIRASMSVPLILQPVKINTGLYVDGGITNNYPINVFDQPLKPNCDTLGVKIKLPRSPGLPISNSNDYICNLWDVYNNIGSSYNDKPIHNLRTINVYVPDITLKKFKLKDLYESGRISVKDYFNI